ncbi:MAG: ABC transporter substrate-binding protein [Methanomassiliicoccales archaeon]|nr:ABC transporter substrate-binding protein [Methanomassiliicoccales archaeon]NYT15642.1 ABC transporter substrate-binding protein [Methanomassiliicoccales archaeon]
MANNRTMAAIAIIIIVIMAGVVGGFIYLNNNNEDGTGDTVEITDWRGENVTIPKYPERIISLGGSFTEVLFSIGAQDQVVGVDKYSDYPPAALEKINVGSGYTLNQEAVMALDPDCVICWGYQTNTIETLEGLGVPVLVYYPGNIQEILWTIESIGNATGRIQAAQDLVSGMESIIDDISSSLSNLTEEEKPKVYFELSSGKSIGLGSITNDLIEMAGGINIYGNATTTYPQPSSEYIIDVNPDVIVIEDQSLKTNQDIASLEGWDAIDAVENNQIYRIDQNLNTVTPRIVEALQTFAHWFHPDLV